MGYEVLVILFIVLSVVSSIINKLHEAKKQRELESAARRGPTKRPVDEEEEEEFDLSDLFPSLELPKSPQPREFREVRGKRTVTEESNGEEFLEVSGRRPVSEEPTGPEFREVRGITRVIEGREGKPAVEREEVAEPLIHTPRAAPGPTRSLYKKERRRRIRLDFKPDSVRNGIIYSEILGPPRGERMFE